MEPREKPAVLLIDDDAVFRQRLARGFTLRGWETSDASTAEEARAAARAFAPDLAVIDLRIQDQSGLDVVRDLHAIDATISLVMLTGYGSIATALEAVKCGARNYLAKPVDVDQILAAYEGAAPEAEPPDTVPSLARVEWEHIQRVLTDCEGNVSKTARLLGLHRRSLQRKLNKYPPRQ